MDIRKLKMVLLEDNKKIENGVVNEFNAISDKFVDHFLTKDGETVEEAKVRLTQKNGLF